MKFFFLLLSITSLPLFAQHLVVPIENMPVPPPSPTRLFYVQRSPNRNTVVYDANVLPNKKLNPKEPINVYWQRFDEKGQKEPLSYIQETLAYGVDTSPFPNEAGAFEGKIVSYKKRRLKILMDSNNNPIALVNINGKQNQLLKIYVMIEETGRLIPKVLYIELFGKDIKTGIDVYERFRP